MKCRQGFEIKVLSSPAGTYLGTKDEDGFANCRCTGYYKYKNVAEQHLLDESFTVRDCMENNFCNGGLGCFKQEKN